MIIAVSGAHRTGKTKLVNNLSEYLPQFQIIQEPYIQLEESGYLFSAVPTAEDYLVQFELSVKQLLGSKDKIIFDRCPLDLLAYMQASSDLTAFDFATLYKTAKVAMSEVDQLVFTTIEDPDVIGCSASELPELRRQVDEILHDLISDFGINFIEVHGSAFERRTVVLKHLSRSNPS